jgi:hypothetical protein
MNKRRVLVKLSPIDKGSFTFWDIVYALLPIRFNLGFL